MDSLGESIHYIHNVKRILHDSLLCSSERDVVAWFKALIRIISTVPWW
jgi:hypothetical protein